MKGDPRTKNRGPEVLARYAEVAAVINAATAPMSSRQVFYQLVAHSGWPKTTSSVAKVKDALWNLRMLDEVDWDRVRDDGRSVEGGDTTVTDYDPAEWVADQVESISGQPTAWWEDQPVKVQVWLEKAGLAPLVRKVTDRYRVSLLVGRGSSSITLQHQGFELLDPDKDNVVLTLFDYDTAGRGMDDDTAEKYDFWSDQAGGPVPAATYVRVAVTPEQIIAWNLPERPDKTAGAPNAVELDAIAPKDLTDTLAAAIEDVLDQPAWTASKEREMELAVEVNTIVADFVETLRDA